ncbi:MAG TPA: hypothetical protein VL651_10220 [Bacteroidia bacterium]|jgi:hypothetical protein|nr:hypothetical protein [Bacteroidia bacterium]
MNQNLEDLPQKEKDAHHYFALVNEFLFRNFTIDSILVSLRKYGEENYDPERYRLSVLWLIRRLHHSQNGKGVQGEKLMNFLLRTYALERDFNKAFIQVSEKSVTNDKPTAILLFFASFQMIKLVPEWGKKAMRRNLLPYFLHFSLCFLICCISTAISIFFISIGGVVIFFAALAIGSFIASIITFVRYSMLWLEFRKFSR